MSLFVVDVEADGPAPGLYSMVSLGAVKFGLHNDPDHGFIAQFRPISLTWRADALAVSGYSREDCLAFPEPEHGMCAFQHWVLQRNGRGRPTFVSDNPAFDWQFVNYYFHRFGFSNPFGFSARRIGDFYAGLGGDFYRKQDWKKLRRTKHTHNPLDDARGNAEALEAILR